MAQENKNQTSSQWKKPFFLFWIGQNISILGSSLVQFALIWWITKQTGSASVLAIAVGITYIPRVILAPFIGALIDRWDRRTILIISDGGIALVTLVMAYLFWAGLIQIWHLYIIFFLRALGETFHWPSMTASTSLMVPEDQLPRINGLNQAIQGGLNVAAPPLGALLLSILPLFGVFSVEILTAAVAVLPLFFLKIPRPAAHAQANITNPQHVFQDVIEAGKFILNWKALRWMMCVSIVANFIFTPVFTMIPILITKYFGGGVWQLSIFESCAGIGMISGGVLLGVWGGFRSKTRTLCLSMLGIGASIFLVGIAPKNWFYLAVAGMFVFSSLNSISNGLIFAMLQGKIPAEFQGRVFTLIGSIGSAITPLALALATPIIERFGAQSWDLLAGVIFFIMGVILLSFPVLDELEKQFTSSTIVQIPASSIIEGG
jgi:MFS transporter, DHA3 family, macrolide efflux protein